MAVNGVMVSSPSEVTALIKEVPCGGTVSFVCRPPNKTSYFHLIMAPSWNDHPGLVFAPTRGDSLVRVSRIFSQGPFAGSGLNVGDLVLAVNGVPVSKVYQADQCLTLSREEPFTILYVANMEAIRRWARKPCNYPEELHDVQVLPPTNDTGLYQIGFKAPKKCREGRIREIKAKNWGTAEYDPETQQLVDPDKFTHMKAEGDNYTNDYTRKKLVFVGRYATKVMPYLDCFNAIMEQQMTLLEEAVVCERWKTCTSSSGNRGSIPPTAPVQEGSVVFAHAQVLPISTY